MLLVLTHNTVRAVLHTRRLAPALRPSSAAVPPPPLPLNTPLARHVDKGSAGGGSIPPAIASIHVSIGHLRTAP